MNLFKKSLVSCVLLGLLSASAYGQGGKKATRAYSAPFGIAGCGLGSVIITEKDKSSQIAASILNVYIGFVSSAITSGTSNCNYSNNVSQIEQSVYIFANLRSLEKEAVQGDGMHLGALAALFGCESNKDKGFFIEFNKKNFESIYNTDDAELVYFNLRNAGGADPELVRACPGIA